MSEGAEDVGDVEQGTKDIVCTDCGTSPRLKSLNKNDGTVTACDCDEVAKSKDMVPYELGVGDLPESWVVIDGRPSKQMAREVDLLHAGGEYECPECGNEWGIGEGTVSCRECGHVPEEVRLSAE